MNRYEFEQFIKQNPNKVKGDAFNKYTCIFRAFTHPLVAEIVNVEDCTSQLYRKLEVLLNNGCKQMITVHF